MEDRVKRGPGGKLALWVFYAFCGYFVWAMARYFWVISQVQAFPGATLDGELGSTIGKWVGALLGFLVLSVVGVVLGYIAWVTRPQQIEE
ncbi:hypothetical protein GTGU_00048 [Trabulsiella guamensis ATCC 49490]|uniref:Cell division protein DrpB n=1 Tax=Trabulsiella guamensis ATCC 49490 TaxID=1005994 RepID=A0A085ASL4_9ENTR|nr:cell division protein DrpB [Trabulsiella guamensis]KFC13209.1 hypothetical protein GTGU_00048 [Trabulsiella guamensis ATCC 49490]